MSMKKCVECGEKVSEEAKLCPYCGKKDPTETIGDKIINFIVGVLIIFGIIWWSPWSPNDVKNVKTISTEEPEVQISPIRVSSKKHYNQYSKTYIPEIVITSISDSITIKNVLVNKGTCKYIPLEWYYDSSRMAHSKKMFPKKLSYGKELVISVPRCSIIRVDVKTNLGDWSVEY